VITGLCISSVSGFAQSRLAPSLQPWDDKSHHGQVSEWWSIYRHILSAVICPEGVKSRSPSFFHVFPVGGHLFSRVGSTPPTPVKFFPAEGKLTAYIWTPLWKSSSFVVTTNVKTHLSLHNRELHGNGDGGNTAVTAGIPRFCLWTLR